MPWDEEGVGGCLAAGRGFVHISAEGLVEACPLAPFSDSSLTRVPLKDALQSRLLAPLRENHEVFDDSAGGCTLGKERERIGAFAASSLGFALSHKNQRTGATMSRRRSDT